MAELRPRSQWRWWSTKTYPNGSLLPMDMTRLYFCDGDSYISMDVTPEFASDAMYPELVVERLITRLQKFKAKEQYNKICGGSDGE